MTLPEPLAVTLRVAESFDRLGLRYLIGRSLASSLHGIPRSTHDADMRRDVLGVLEVQGTSFDLTYARKWAEHLGVLDLLERALDEASGS